MRKATRISASVLGLTAGLAGTEHGIFEVLQANARPEGLMVFSKGPPCVPELSWNQCEPAMTVILLGAAIIRFAGWPILGWVIVALGIMALWLAHLFAVAPIYDEPTDITDRADW